MSCFEGSLQTFFNSKCYSPKSNQQVRLTRYNRNLQRRSSLLTCYFHSFWLTMGRVATPRILKHLLPFSMSLWSPSSEDPCTQILPKFGHAPWLVLLLLFCCCCWCCFVVAVVLLLLLFCRWYCYFVVAAAVLLLLLFCSFVVVVAATAVATVVPLLHQVLHCCSCCLLLLLLFFIWWRLLFCIVHCGANAV